MKSRFALFIFSAFIFAQSKSEASVTIPASFGSGTLSFCANVASINAEQYTVLSGDDTFAGDTQDFAQYVQGICSGGGNPGCTNISLGNLANQSTSPGVAATFSISASGSSPSYSWQTCMTNCGVAANWGPAPGATNSSSYTFQNPLVGDNGRSFRVTVSNTCPSSLTSNTATLSVGSVSPPVITQHPSNQNVSVGQTAIFNADASGSNISFQWQQCSSNCANPASWTNIPGATLINYNRTNVPLADSGLLIRMSASNTGGSVFSNAATLTVGQPPAISAQPQTIATPLTVGQTANFSVTASGTPTLNYQWQICRTPANCTLAASWQDIVGANSAALSFTTTIADDNARLRVTVTNGYGTPATSDGLATLDVVPSAPTITLQPQDQSVANGGTATFSVQVAGPGPFNYQWERQTSSGGAWSPIQGANSSTYQIIAQLGSNDQHRFRVRINQGGPDAISNSAGFIFNLFIVIQPVDVTVDEGDPAAFSVVAGPIPGVFTYQWKQCTDATGSNCTNLSDGQNIVGANLSSLVIPNPTVANQNNTFYRVEISNFSGVVISSVAKLVVNPPACSAPSVPTPVSPLANAQNISLLPSLSWQPVSANPTCSVTYDVRVSTTAANNCANPVSSGSTVGTIFNVASFLNPQTTYYWCVRANANGTPGGWSSPINFMTTTADVPTPTNLYTLPYTTPASPAGNKQIILGAMNGEPMATGIFYLKQQSGDIIVGSTLIGNLPGGRFEISIDVTAHGAATGPREYYARQQRFGTPQPGAPSDSVVYYYDESLSQGAFAPALQKNDPNTIGSLKWNAMPGAVSYNVYRRVNLMTENFPATANQLYEGTDGLGPKPYTLVANVISTPIGGFVNWTDANLAAELAAVPLTLSPDGVSYFVTAVNSQQIESQRSNSQSFVDTVGPIRSQLHEGGVPSAPFLQQVFYLGTPTGRSAKGYMCNVNPMGYFHGPDYRENSADILAFVQVKLKPVGTSCAALSYDQGAQSYSVPFDSLRTVDIGGFNDCLSIGEVGNETLIPATDYCFKTCLKDTSANSEINCLEATFGQTLPDGQAPDFAGVKEVTPEETGTSLAIEWDPPTYQQQILEPITYIVKATNTFVAGGEPVFDSEDVITKEVDSSQLSTALENLQTGRTYCIRVAARDTAQNENGNNTTKCASTLNNAPFVDGLSITSDLDEPQKINIEFRVVDRNSGDGVRLDRLAFKTAEVANWIEVSSTSLSGNSDFLASANSLESAPMHKVIFDSLAYFIGQRDNFALQLTFVDAQGNQTVVESQPETAYYSNSRNASYSRSARIGCTSSASSNVQGDLFLVLFCLLGMGGALALQWRRWAVNR